MLSHHFVYSFLFSFIFSIFFKTYKSKLIIMIFFLVFFNIKLFFNFSLSINDFLLSFLGNMSLFSLLNLIILTFCKKFYVKKEIFFIFLINLLFFFAFLNLIPINIYYQSTINSLLIINTLIVFTYFVSKKIAILYLFCFACYAFSPREIIFNFFFDANSLIIFFAASICVIICCIINKIKTYFSQNNY